MVIKRENSKYQGTTLNGFNSYMNVITPCRIQNVYFLFQNIIKCIIWCYVTQNYFLFTNLHVQAHVQTLPHTAESLFPLWSHPLCHGGPPPDVLVALGDPGSQSPSPPAPRLRSCPLSWLVSWKTWLLWQFTEETLDENIPCLPCMFLS